MPAVDGHIEGHNLIGRRELYFLRKVRVSESVSCRKLNGGARISLTLLDITFNKIIRDPAKNHHISFVGRWPVKNFTSNLLDLLDRRWFFLCWVLCVVCCVLVGTRVPTSPPSRRLVRARVRPSGLHFTNGLHEHDRLCFSFTGVCSVSTGVLWMVREFFFVFHFPAQKKIL